MVLGLLHDVEVVGAASDGAEAVSLAEGSARTSSSWT